MSAAVPVGALRTRLTLQAPADVADDTGAFTRSWTSVAALWGRVVARDGRQQFEADAVEVAITHLVTIRSRPDVVNGTRFLVGDRTLVVHAVTDPDGRGRHLLCRCEEFAP